MAEVTEEEEIEGQLVAKIKTFTNVVYDNKRVCILLKNIRTSKKIKFFFFVKYHIYIYIFTPNLFFSLLMTILTLHLA